MIRAAQERQSVSDAGRELLREGLVARTWGNVSCRVSDDVFAITPSGLSYDKMTADDVVIYNSIDGTFEGVRKPSSEKKIHAAAYASFVDAGFVIHTHQTYASALGLAGFSDIKLTVGERQELGGIALAEYGLPGSKQLAKNVNAALESGAHTVLMAHHGALIAGKDSSEAFERAKLLEKVCERACKIESSNCGNTEKAKCLAESVRAKFGHAAYSTDAVVVKVAATTNAIHAQLDDMAQMIGPKLACITFINKEDVLRILEKTDCVLIKNVGAIVKATSDDDCIALKQLIEKSCVCYLHTKAYNKGAKLPAFEAALMRMVYTKKYSKKIGE